MNNEIAPGSGEKKERPRFKLHVVPAALGIIVIAAHIVGAYAEAADLQAHGGSARDDLGHSEPVQNVVPPGVRQRIRAVRTQG